MIITDKNGSFDARNALGWWSFFKWVIDITIVVCGGGLLIGMPNVIIWSLVFVLWIWSLVKMITDTPLVILWLIGKIQHFRRRKNDRRKN